MAVQFGQQDISKQYLPKLDPLMRGAGQGNYAPILGQQPMNFERLMPNMSGIGTNNFMALAPNFGGVKTTGPSIGSLMPGNFFAPGFGQSQPGYFDLNPAGQQSTFSDFLRQHGLGQFKPVVPQPGGMPGVGGVIADLGNHPLNQYDAFFQEAGKFGVDPLLLKAIAYVESGWNDPVSKAGAVGIMQLMPNWETDLGHPVDRMDPRQNILAGAEVLMQKFREGNGTWEDAIRRYHGYGSDAAPGFAGTTDQQYLDQVMGWYNQLKAAAPKAGSTPVSGGGSGLSSLFGGSSFGISQEIGGHAMDYGYGEGLGVGNSHPGIDIATPGGTNTFFPGMGGGVTGTVVYSGGTGYFCYYNACGQGVGELRIQLSNGDIIIFGHMSNIAVRPGQVVNVGTFLGKTGGAGSGDHLHLEYRQANTACSSQFCAIDPRRVIGY